MIRKNPEVDLRLKYQKTFEIALIISLALIIFAFKFFPDVSPPDKILKNEQEIVDVEDIEITKQENRPPPPPRPPIPIEAPSDEAIDDVEISSSELQPEVVPPPPPDADEEVYFVAVEDLPEPVGGIAAIQRAVVYPEIAKRAGVEGTVYVEAFVDESGNVTRTNIVKGIGAGCDEAAQAAVNKTKFKPGKQRGKAVKVRMSIPIRFRLQK